MGWVVFVALWLVLACYFLHYGQDPFSVVKNNQDRIFMAVRGRCWQSASGRLACPPPPSARFAISQATRLRDFLLWLALSCVLCPLGSRRSQRTARKLAKRFHSSPRRPFALMAGSSPSLRDEK